MLRTVSSELVRVTGAPARLSSGQASSTWSRKQWPTLSRIVCSPASSDGSIDLRVGPRVALRHDDLERLLVEELGRHARRVRTAAR